MERVMKTTARDAALVEEIAAYFDMLASDSEAMAARGYDKKENKRRAGQWREAAADVRTIELIDAPAARKGGDA